MARRKKSYGTAADHAPLDADWVVTTALKVNGRDVTPGTEVKITGESGRFAFRRHVLNPANAAEWVDVYGGPKGEERVRSFRPSRIATVHRLRKARP